MKSLLVYTAFCLFLLVKNADFYKLSFNSISIENDFFSQSKNVYVEITFNKGSFMGTHLFKPEKGNYLSQINVEFFDGYSNINASKLVTENGLQIHHFNRTLLGNTDKGSHDAKMFTKGCGHLNFIDVKNNMPYKRVDSDFVGCNKTLIKETTPWKDGVVKKRRLVSGSFQDTVQFEFTMDDGSKKQETVDVVIKFKANQSIRK
ncbi:hypothetical protein FUA26_02830 [Seonamhaeicola algicola]|uniref:Uncharacterized protein n=1 Tax=Seonamhaeicola algicola TaxID=1719036 RepID=A0A5C7AZ40_9FLAO|nr:hypothetical protein [Seonamhaeicola algicola]TXE12749.1 hypothetical protein FUA26_02830 [Seonamhaeicola algicola]